jgi:thiamine biosynthesis protein ThiC
MTQIEHALNGRVSDEMKAVAAGEPRTAGEIRDEREKRAHVILKSLLHDCVPSGWEGAYDQDQRQ